MTNQNPPTPLRRLPEHPVREHAKSGHLRHSLRTGWRLEDGQTYPVTIGTITSTEAPCAR